ncbi:glycoside hydrolase family 15 protein [Pseudarthrobacter sp. PS3-L1]|uniref:glycoside hydrolase family 15 protein n=1 Tax=Pseudarthrobacter sp. PS3-L1 TaxID=3046207 RepID=UPI0024BA0568|nr:glycoside hydrolase family 15 protein [Pseudarthrobacter sp. PS3-L1]MDJ0319264.1 glycoside hydrolase family 15 protein [Pseudarthrobacter sp. PS3-L1]
MRTDSHRGSAAGAPLRDANGYADLRSYAAIGDGRTLGLVAADGRIDWLPLPSLDSVTPFASLLDAEFGGYLTLAPTEPFTSERHYLEKTNVLVTVFSTERGKVQITDALNTGISGRLPWSEVGRRIEGLEGNVTLRAEVRPGTCLGQFSPWIQDTVHGVVLRIDGLTMAVRSAGEDQVSWDDGAITITYQAEPGSKAIFGLVATEGEPLFLPAPETVDAGIDRTVEKWQAWSDSFSYDGEYAEQVHRSVLTLKLLIMGDAGSVAAAGTTSLPENIRGGKNWDYRYAWVRDTAYSLTALFRFGLREETHAAMSWLLRTIRSSGDTPAVMYRLDGSACIEPVSKHDAPGWRGIGPVVTGNRASEQLQLGVFGDVFSIVGLYVDHGNVLDAQTGRTLAGIADMACDAWRRPDAGMWELTELQHYTSSKMGCWHALQQAVHLAEIGQVPGDPSRWRTEAERIRTWVEENCWSEDLQAYVWYPGSTELDASVLLHAISGFDRGPRMSSTLDALDRELAVGPHLYRFSGASDEEATFIACSYWMVTALQLCGRTGEARERMGHLAEAANDVGILAEMFEPSNGSSLGNLPQALSHLALINAAISLDQDTAETPAAS